MNENHALIQDALNTLEAISQYSAMFKAGILLNDEGLKKHIDKLANIQAIIMQSLQVGNQKRALRYLVVFHDLNKNNAGLEAKLAHDADTLDMILNLKRELDLGNKTAAAWLRHALPRLRTQVGKDTARMIVETDHNAWWFQGPDAAWWEQR